MVTLHKEFQGVTVTQHQTRPFDGMGISAGPLEAWQTFPDLEGQVVNMYACMRVQW